MRFAMFFMAEYMNMITVSALAVTLFLGGWHAPLPFNLIPGANSGYWGLVWFVLKVLVMLFIFVWLRGTLPRLRYDQFMALGWKILIPISLVWLLAVATVKAIQLNGGLDRPVLLVAVGVLLVALLVLTIWPSRKTDEDRDDRAVSAREHTEAARRTFPTPPMPAGGATRGAAQPLVFSQGRTGNVVREEA